eukprot:7616_1
MTQNADDMVLAEINQETLGNEVGAMNVISNSEENEQNSYMNDDDRHNINAQKHQGEIYHEQLMANTVRQKQTILQTVQWILILYAVITVTYLVIIGNPNNYKSKCECSTAQTFDTTKNATTGNPTFNPSGYPTSYPTITPSNNPIITSSNNPTITPSDNPTETPSDNPTATPSNNPTTTPSNNPTLIPTISPTNYPTKLPTNAPTNVPLIYGYADRLHAGIQTNYTADGTEDIIFPNVNTTDISFTRSNFGNMLNVSNGRFTAPITGLYIFTISVWLDNGNPNDAQSVQLLLRYNNNPQTITFGGPIATNTAIRAGTVMIRIKKNDYIAFAMYTAVVSMNNREIFEHVSHTYARWLLIQPL